MPISDVIKKEIEEAFILYDTEEKGKISGREFAQACKALGFLCGFPTQTECDEYAEISSFSKKAFCKELEDRALRKKVLTEGGFFFWEKGNPFKVLDKGNTGTISGEELRKVMCSLGNKMTEDEYRHMFESFGGKNPGDGPCDYKKLYSQIQAVFKRT